MPRSPWLGNVFHGQPARLLLCGLLCLPARLRPPLRCGESPSPRPAPEDARQAYLPSIAVHPLTQIERLAQHASKYRARSPAAAVSLPAPPLY